jgi:hypothetical protein
MHNSRKGVASCHVDIGSVAYVLDDLTEIDQIGRVENIADNRRRSAARRYGGTRDGNTRVIEAKDAIVTRGTDEPPIVLCEPIDTEFLAIVKRQLTNHRAQRYLRGFDVHFVEDFFHLHHHLAIAKHDD